MIEAGLRLLVAESFAAANRSALYVCANQATHIIEIQLPQHARTVEPGEQARPTFAQSGWVQRGPLVREVERDAPRPRFQVNRVPRCHEGRHIRNGVEKTIPIW